MLKLIMLAVGIAGILSYFLPAVRFALTGLFRRFLKDAQAQTLMVSISAAGFILTASATGALVSFLAAITVSYFTLRREISVFNVIASAVWTGSTILCGAFGWMAALLLVGIAAFLLVKYAKAPVGISSADIAVKAAEALTRKKNPPCK